MNNLTYLLQLFNLRVESAVHRALGGDIDEGYEIFLKAQRVITSHGWAVGYESPENAFICNHNGTFTFKCEFLPPYLAFYPEYRYTFWDAVERGRKQRARLEAVFNCGKREVVSATYASTADMYFDEESLSIQAEWDDLESRGLVRGSCLEGSDGGWIDDDYPGDD